jgi:hypothetical protein
MHNLGVSAWTGMTVRNILYGSTLACLAKRYKITIVSYYGGELGEALPSELTHKLSFARLEHPRWHLPALRGRIQAILASWNIYALWESQHTLTLWLYHIRREWELTPKIAIINRLGGKFVNSIRKNPNQDWLRDLAYCVPIKKQFGHLDAMFVASVNTPKDRQIIYSCKRYGIPVVALVHSWDNLTSKGLFPAIPDRLLVWNEMMAKEANNLHGVPEEAIDIVGGPQYEIYRKLAPELNQTNFRNRLYIPSTDKIITFTGSAEWLHPDEDYLIDMLLAKVSEGYFGNATLLLRLHPTEPRSVVYQEKYQDSTLPIRIDWPDSGFAAQNTGSIGNFESIKEFVELLLYSDVIINMSSTITVDAVCFDTPVICTNFNVNLKRDKWNAAQNNFLTNHFYPIRESDAVYLPESMEDLYVSIDNALKNPDQKSLGRRNLAEIMIPDLPTGQLIAESIESVRSQFLGGDR